MDEPNSSLAISWNLSKFTSSHKISCVIKFQIVPCSVVGQKWAHNHATNFGLCNFYCRLSTRGSHFSRLFWAHTVRRTYDQKSHHLLSYNRILYIFLVCLFKVYFGWFCRKGNMNKKRCRTSYPQKCFGFWSEILSKHSIIYPSAQYSSSALWKAS